MSAREIFAAFCETENDLKFIRALIEAIGERDAVAVLRELKEG